MGPFPEDRLVIAPSFLREMCAIQEGCNLFYLLFIYLNASTTKRLGKDWDCLGNVFQHHNTSTYSGESMFFALLSVFHFIMKMLSRQHELVI